MEILDIVLHSVLLGTFLYIVYTTKKRSNLFQNRVRNWDSYYSNFLILSKLHNIDIAMDYEKNSEIIEKKNLEGLQDIIFLDTNINKGFDFIIFTGGKGTRVDAHHHDVSKKYIYVLSGKIVVTINGSKKTLSAGDSIFIENKKVHSIDVVDECKYVSIAIPPLISEVTF